MASTYSANLKLELMGTGDQSGTWGDTTNTNLGTLLEQAIVGYAAQSLVGAGPTTLAIPNGGTGVGRNYILEFTGAPTASHNVIVPAVYKSYIVYNNTNTTIVIKVLGQTGVTIASGKKAIVYNNGIDVIEVVNDPATQAGVQTLTNKTISVDNNTISGIAASSFVLSNGSGNIDGAAAQKVIPAGVVVGDTDSQTLTNKTISADNNTISGIAASSFVVSNASGNIDGAAAQKVIPAGVVVGTTDTQTLTNKRITSRILSQANPASISADVSLYDQYVVTALAQTLSIPASTTGTPTNGDKIIFRIKDNGVSARTLTWTTTGAGSWRAVGVILPTTTTLSKVTYVGAIYNSDEAFWDVVAVSTQV